MDLPAGPLTGAPLSFPPRSRTGYALGSISLASDVGLQPLAEFAVVPYDGTLVRVVLRVTDSNTTTYTLEVNGDAVAAGTPVNDEDIVVVDLDVEVSAGDFISLAGVPNNAQVCVCVYFS